MTYKNSKHPTQRVRASTSTLGQLEPENQQFQTSTMQSGISGMLSVYDLGQYACV